MLKELKEHDYCPHCVDVILYMGEADFDSNLVKFNCPHCEYFEARQIKVITNEKED